MAIVVPAPAASTIRGIQTFLQLTQAVKRESGLSGGGPAAFASATGDDLRLFHWVAWAWRDIDLMHEGWSWRRGSASTTTSGSITIPPTTTAGSFGLTDFGSWMYPNSQYRPSAYLVSSGQQSEQALKFLDYDSFRRKFLIGTHAAGPLTYWSIHPNGDFLVGPTPDAAHVVRADYIKDHIALAADADAPTMPSRFHPLIVWYALREYGGYDAASEVWQRADRNYNAGFLALSQACLPRMRWGGKPLA